MFRGGVFLKEKIKTFFSLCVLVVTVPYIVTLLFQGNQADTQAKKTELLTQEDLPLTVDINGQELEIEEYLAGIVAQQVPLDNQPEAIKAQAVIARTALLHAVTHEEEMPDSMSREEMLTLWGQDGFEKNYKVLENALEATEGEVLIYEEALIQAAFHAVSAGTTRTAKEAIGSELPYLDSVDSSVDIPSPDYLKVIFLEKSALAEKLNQAADAGLTPETLMEQISVSSRDSSDYALEIKVGDKTMSGEEFRNCLELNSSCCYIKEVEGKVRIVTKGLGHGLGLSQYGANTMAKEGGNYKEILQYYYKDAEITKKIQTYLEP